MQAFFKNERNFFGVLIFAALLGVASITWSTLDTYSYLPESEKGSYVNPRDVQDRASQFLTETFGINTAEYDQAIATTFDARGLMFINEADTTHEEDALYTEKYSIPSTEYYVRFFKEYELEEYAVYLNAYTSTVTGFGRIMTENTPRTDADDSTAYNTALSYVLKTEQYTAEQVELLDQSSNTQEGGTDHTFTFKFIGSEIPSIFGEGYMTVVVVLQGDTIGSYTRVLHVPEEFDRSYATSSSSSIFLGLLSVLVTVILTIIAGVIMMRRYKAGTLIWKQAYSMAIVLFVVTLITAVDSYPLLKTWFTTDIPFELQTIISLVVIIFFGIISVVVFFIATSAGITLETEGNNDRIFPIKSTLPIKEKLAEIRKAITRGYLIGIAVLGFTLFLYWIGETYLGVWYELIPGDENSLLTFVPAVSTMITFGIIAAVTEEFIFRVFGIAFLRKYFKSAFAAGIFATFIWALAHSDGTVFPFWFRAAEVFISGLLFVYFYLRYNVLTTIIAHYTHNCILGAMSLIFGIGMTQVIPSVIMLGFPIICYFGYKIYLIKKDQGEIVKA